MGFMDKAKKLAEQAQAKMDEVQGQFNERQQQGAGGPGGPAVEYDQHGRPTPAEPVPDEAVAQVQEAAEKSADAPAPTVADVDRSHEAAPKLTGGDPLAG
jgi:hypothetical protein